MPHPSSGGGARRLGSIGRALGQRNYRLYFGGQGLSVIGTWMTRVAVSWLVFRLTGSAWMLGVVAFSGQIPQFLLSPFAGVWVDRVDKHRLLVVTQALAMLQSFALAALAFTHITVTEIIALMTFQGVINALDMPGRQSFMVDMVEEPELLGNAIALNSSMVNMARLVGPAVAGILIAAFGEGWCFLLDGISYVAVIWSLLAMHDLPRRARRLRQPMLESLREGWTYVSGFRPARSLLILLALAALLGMPYSTLLPIFAAHVLHGGAHLYGFLMGAAGCGALAGALRLAARKSVRGLTGFVPWSAALFGAALIVFGLSHWVWLSLLLVFFAGMGMMQQLASTNTILQTISSEDKRGRVMAFYAMSFAGMAPWGNLMIGGIAHHLGAPRTLMLTGACLLAGTWWFSRQLPAMRAAIRPVYQQLGIVPEVTRAVQSATSLTTPPEE